MHPKVKEVLNNCTIDGNIVKLPPGQLDRDIYMSVATQLNNIGGKWKGGKTSGFVFEEDPTPYMEFIQSGEELNLKKEYQFFASPIRVVQNYITGLIPRYNEAGLKILEPSAGRGAIVDELLSCFPGSDIYLIEKMPVNLFHLRRKYSEFENVHFPETRDDDFLNYNPSHKFDIIAANPPFSKDQDIDHIRHMYSLLADNGVLITLSSGRFRHVTQKRVLQFKDWLDSLDASIVEIPAGEFKESGTNISAVSILIEKDGPSDKAEKAPVNDSRDFIDKLFE